jgi:DNA gyrase subunit B
VSENSHDDIKVLKGLEAVRRRPAMYVGDMSDGNGLHNLLWGLVDVFLDQHLARLVTELHVNVEPTGWVCLHDDGPGIPVERRRSDGTTELEAAFTTMSAGHMPFARGLFLRFAVAVPAANALSTRLEVQTTRREYGSSFAAILIGCP